MTFVLFALLKDFQGQEVYRLSISNLLYCDYCLWIEFHRRMSLQKIMQSRAGGEGAEGMRKEQQLTACLYFCTYSLSCIRVLLYYNCIIVCIVYQVV